MYRSEDLSACVRSSLPRTLTRPTHFFPLPFFLFSWNHTSPCYCGCCFLRWEGKREKVVLLVLLVLALLSCAALPPRLLLAPFFTSPGSLTHSLTHGLSLTHLFSSSSRFPFYLSVCPSSCLPCPVPTLH